MHFLIIFENIHPFVRLQMTDMQIMDDENSVVPQTNPVNLAEDWKLLGDYSLDNMFMPLFLSSTALLFGIGVAFGWYSDKRMSRGIHSLEQRMYLLGGDVTSDSDNHEKAEQKTRKNWQQKCWSYWKCWECNQVRVGHHKIFA